MDYATYEEAYTKYLIYSITLVRLLKKEFNRVAVIDRESKGIITIRWSVKGKIISALYMNAIDETITYMEHSQGKVIKTIVLETDAELLEVAGFNN